MAPLAVKKRHLRLYHWEQWQEENLRSRCRRRWNWSCFTTLYGI